MRSWIAILSVPGVAAIAAGVVLYLSIFAKADNELRGGASSASKSSSSSSSASSSAELQTATFGAGCFWCTEAVFQRLNGVYSVTSGYSGGKVKNPTYEQVCKGDTGHAECIQLTFDPKVISYVDLLEIFWQTHDPTTKNRQGPDTGTQYRSAIFYHTEEQKELAEKYKKKLDESGAFSEPIVTEVTKFSEFYPAEKYHQNFFNDNPKQDYCKAVIRPKIDKFEKVFKEKLKEAPK
jgi:peptide-methionine (S)-S-oxide reductase